MREIVKPIIFAKCDNSIYTYIIRINLTRVRKLCACSGLTTEMKDILKDILCNVFDDGNSTLSLSFAIGKLFNYISANPNENVIYRELFKCFKFKEYCPRTNQYSFFEKVKQLQKTDTVSDNASGVFDPKTYQDYDYKSHISKLPTSEQMLHSKPSSFSRKK